MSKKEHILELSSRVFLKFGLHKISMDELADQIGISKKTIYNYFGSKENLLENIIYSIMNNCLNRINNILGDKSKSVIDKISLSIDYLYKQYVALENPAKLDPNAAKVISSPQFLVLRKQMKDSIIKLGNEAQNQGLVKEHLNPAMFPYIFLNTIRGSSIWEADEETPFSKLNLMRCSLDILLDGILTPHAMDEFINKKRGRSPHTQLI